MNKGKKVGIGLFVSIVLILLDQITKILVVTHLKSKSAVEIISGVFELRYLENQGAAFGIMQQKQGFFIILTLIMLTVLVICFVKIPSGKKYYAMNTVTVLLFSGAIGNFIDRIRYQYVIDFLYFKLIDFPIFNVADCYVTVSVFAFIYLILFYYKEEDLQFIDIFGNKKKESENK